MKLPDNDDRDYKHLVLENGMNVLLISDPTTDKAACALQVSIGSLNSADGLAHFLEHMLFMGTQTFPVENEYSSYLNKNGGSSNAYTAPEETNYYFDVVADAFEGALQRFSAFFKCPLLLKDSEQREMLAVDSEFKKNLNNDNNRLYQVFKGECGAPYNVFDCGNLESLSSLGDISSQLRKLYDDGYSADLMSVVLLGKEPIDKLKQYAELFAKVQRKSGAAEFKMAIQAEHPLNKLLGKQIFAKPIKNIRYLDMEFALPAQSENKWSHAMYYLSHLIGHESEGSLCSLLKSRNLATSLSSGGSSGHGSPYFDLFTVKISLTEQGVEKYREVVQMVFSYLNMLKREGFQERVYQEHRVIHEMDFRFREKRSNVASYVSGLANSVWWYKDRPDLIVKGSDHFDDDSSECKRVTDKLLQTCFTPDNFALILVAAKAPPGFQYQTTKTERWYNIEYHVGDIGKLGDAPLINELKLPRVNPFVPKNLDLVVKPSQNVEYPRLVMDDEFARVWHGIPSLNVPVTPKQYVYFDIKAPLAYAPSPLNAVLSALYVELVKEVLAEEGYEAELAQVNFNISTQNEGFGCTFNGVGEGVLVIIQMVLNAMRTFPVIYASGKEELFETIKDKLTRNLESWTKEQPHKHAIFFTTQVLQQSLWTHPQKLEVIKSVTLSQVIDFVRLVVWQNVYVEMLCFGNVSRDQAVSIGKLTVDALSNKTGVYQGVAISAPVHESLRQISRSHVLPESKSFAFVLPGLHAENPNSAIEIFLQVGEIQGESLGVTCNPRVRTSCFVLSQIIQEPAFDQLRTKEQLGYIVFSGTRKALNSLGIRFIVQSEKDPVHLDQRVEAFLIYFRDVLVKLDKESFQKYIDTVIALISEKDKSMYAESNRYWKHISNGYYEFDQHVTDVEALRKLTLQDVVELFDTFIAHGAPRRAKFSLLVQSSKVPIQALSDGVVQVANIEEFKKSLALSQTAVPVNKKMLAML